MTEQDQDAVVGRLYREDKECSELLARLAAEADRLGQEYEKLGRTLQIHPGGVYPERASIEPRFMKDGCPFRPSLFDMEKLVKLTNDYREASLKVRRLEQQIVQAGYPLNRPPHS